MESNRLVPLVILLSIGLVVTTYLYIDARSTVDEPPYEPGVVDDLVEDLDKANEEITRLGDGVRGLICPQQAIGPNARCSVRI